METPSSPELSEYCGLDATDVARLVRSGELDPADVRRLAHERYVEVNPDINAVVEWYGDPSPPLTTDGALAGVPVLVKDYGSAEAGRLVEMGSRLAAGNRATSTSRLVARLQAAGAQVLGRTAAPEFVQHGTTETALFGATRNPYDFELSAGGSSGGSAAAVAAGIVPAAHGSDCAGSIRIPAATCGLVGLKPGLHMVPLEDGGWGGIANEFALTRSLRDARLFLDVLATGPFVSSNGPYRIALSTEHWAGCAPDTDVVAATETAAQALEAAGHTIVRIPQPVDYEQLMSTFSALFHRWLVHDVDRLVGEGRVESDETLEPLTRIALAELRTLTVADISAAQVRAGEITAELERAIAGFDVLLTPSLGRATIPLGQIAGDVASLDEYIRLNDELFPYSYLFNVTGWPSLSVPALTTAVGMPLGVQLSARRGTEHLLLDIAAAI